MAKLSVNINKIATIRNARGGNNPNIVTAAKKCIEFGAQGITIHPRPDERHIKYADVHALKPIVTEEFNIEGNPNTAFIDLVMEIKPDQVTLVPDSPNVLTSNAGWDCIKNAKKITSIIDIFKKEGIRTSVFLDADVEQVKAAKQIGADRIELYTESYARQYHENKELAIKPFIEAALECDNQSLGLNAGHDLDLDNLAYFNKSLSNLLEVSIGHALICNALYLGLETTINRYKKALGQT